MVIFKKVIKNWKCQICNGRACQEFIDKYSVSNLFFIHTSATYQTSKQQYEFYFYSFLATMEIAERDYTLER